MLQSMRSARRGFTLVEVALAVAVGLIIIGGAVLGYNAVRDNAANMTAHNRVLLLETAIEENMAVNSGRVMASTINGGPVSTMWVAKNPDSASVNPWGGATVFGTGISEWPPANFGSTTQPTAATQTFATIAGPDRAGLLCYISSSTQATPWCGMTATGTQSLVTVKNYACGIADKLGNPWWDIKGGR